MLPKYQLSQNVYPPSEDTFLFIDTLESEASYLKAQIRNIQVAVELGSGSGVISSFLLKILNRKEQQEDKNQENNQLATQEVQSLSYLLQCFTISVDLNPEACQNTQNTLLTNNKNQSFDVINSSLLDSFQDYKIDVLICNPPYVPTSNKRYSQSQNQKNINCSYAGGKNGLKFINQLLKVLDKKISLNGIVYLLTILENGEPQVSSEWEIKKIAEKKIIGEYQFIWKITRKQQQSNLNSQHLSFLQYQIIFQIYAFIFISQALFQLQSQIYDLGKIILMNSLLLNNEKTKKFELKF